MPTLESLLAIGVTQLNAERILKQVGSQPATTTTSTSTSTGTTAGGTGGTGSGATPAPAFKTLGVSASFDPASFAQLREGSILTSAEVSAQTAKAYGQLWQSDELAAQLTAGNANGGALFARVVDETATPIESYQKPTIADVQALSPGAYDGFSIDEDRANPFGFYVTDGTEERFVRVLRRVDGTSALQTAESVNGGSATAEQRAAFEANAKTSYFAFDSFVNSTISSFKSRFSGVEEVLLGVDQDGNGTLDDETELVGFDNGVALDTSGLAEGDGGLALAKALTGGDHQDLLALRSDGGSVRVQDSSGYQWFENTNFRIRVTSELFDTDAGAEVRLKLEILG